MLLLIVVAVLLAVSLLTIRSVSRVGGPATESYGAYLFRPRGRRESLASSIGSVFSVTYFFGAAFIYGVIFGTWIRLVAVVAFTCVAVIVIRIVKILDGDTATASDANILLDFCRRRMPTGDFRILIWMLSLVYFALLVEELAVSRLILFMLTGQPLIVALLLTTICFVVYTYIYLGGFSAVVTADTVQIIVLSTFICLLMYLLARYSTINAFFTASRVHVTAGIGLNLFGAALFGLAWFIPAIDLYSRLNFAARQKGKETNQFIVSSIALTCLLVLVGAAFGECLSKRLSITSPSEYVSKAIDFFLGESPVVALIFIAAVFSMIFTTIDTLLLCNLQVGYYQRRRWFRRENLFKLFLGALVISTRMDFDATSAVGIFVGSCMVFPALATVRVLWPSFFKLLPSAPAYLFIALIAASLVFIRFFYLIELRFDHHFWLTVLTFASALVFAVLMQVIQLIANGLRRISLWT